MRSDQQKETSRRNGAKSHGPVTAAGKLRASANAVKHGITAKALLIPGESAEELEAHFDAYRQRFQPADPVELDLVDNLAFIAWRQRRLWRRESEIVTDDAATTARRHSPPDHAGSEAWRSLAHQPVFALAQREEAGLRRGYDRALRNLRELQSTRPEPPPAPLPPSDDAKFTNEPEPPPTPSLTSALEASPRSGVAAGPLSENGMGTVALPVAARAPHPRPPAPAAIPPVSLA